MSAVARVMRLLVVLALVTASALGCRSKEPTPEQFVGKWKSSRMNSAPLLLNANGEWEIKADDGPVMQFGVWKVEGRNLVWYVKMDGKLLRDSNAIVSLDKRRFELRERDGSVTRFERLD